MKRNFLLLLCVIALMAACLASCNNHEHTFSEGWDSDATNHWHPATCEHGEQKNGLATHTDANEDGVCDVCAKEIGHTHTFAEEWSMDDDNHWKVATCSHADEKGELSLHSDEDINGSCDVCSGHVHDVNAAGYCKYSDCGEKVKEIDETNIDELVSAVLAQQGLINGGNIDYVFTGNSNTGAEYTATKNDIVDYVFGKDNYTYVKVVTDTINGGVKANGQFETWHQLSGPEDTFGVYSNDNGATFAMDISDVGKLNGHYIALSTLAGEYGVEFTLYALYEVAIGDTATDLEIIPDVAENKVTFKYNYKTVFVNSTQIAVGDNVGSMVHNVSYFEVEVTFKYSDDYALTDLMISVDCYTNDPGTAQTIGFLYADVDLEYDPETDTFIFVEYVQNENGEWVCNRDQDTVKRTPDNYTINVTQTIGPRTEENPHPKSQFIPKDFDLYTTKEDILDSKGSEIGYNLKDKVTGSLNTPAGETVNLFVGNYSPVGTSLEFIADQITVKLYKDGVLVENPGDYGNKIAVAMPTFSGDLRSFFIIPRGDGVYKLEIYVMGDLVKEVTIIAGVVDEGQLDLKDNEFAVKVTDTFTWVDEYTFTAGAAGTYYFTVPAGVGFTDADAFDAAEDTPATDDTPIPYFDYQNLGSENGGSFYIDLDEGESIRFYVSGVKNGTYIISFFTI